MRINIQPYNPTWPATFSQIQSSLEFLLRAYSVPFLAIEHVGSTAVPGLAAKPIIDIDIVVTPSALPTALAALTNPSPSSLTEEGKPNYTYIGDRGIPHRHALREPGFDGDDGGSGTTHTRNVYVCIEGCLALRNHLAVRDTLRRDEALRKEYEDVKLKAAMGREWESVDGYVEAKTEVLIKILERGGGFGVEERREVEGLNVRGAEKVERGSGGG